MTAVEAREKTLENLKNRTDEQLITVMDEINRSIETRTFVAFVYIYLSEEVLEKITNLGYKVTKLKDFGMGNATYEIDWSDLTT